MKATIYVFGNFAHGYSQYPDDYTRNIFGYISKSRKGASELVYHREGALTYYIYTREISDKADIFIGLCYVFNDILVVDFPYLFDIFEDAVTNIVVKGELLEFSDDGRLTTKIGQLYTHTDELQRVTDYLNSKLSTLGMYAEKLPPVNYAISNKEWKTYSFEEAQEAQNELRNYSNIRVVKGENYDTESIKGYANKLKKQSEEIKSLTNEIQKQKTEITKLNQQKKQIKWVVFMLGLFLIGGCFFYFYAQEKSQVIRNKTEEIGSLQGDVQDKYQKIESLKKDSIVLARQKKIIIQRLLSVHDILEDSVPKYMYFDSWSSTNSGESNSTSQIIYHFYACDGDELSIPYFVSSEAGCDFLKIFLKRDGFSEQQMLKESGEKSGTFSHTFNANGNYQLIIAYSKDGSYNNNRDRAGVHQFFVYRPIVQRLLEISEYKE